MSPFEKIDRRHFISSGLATGLMLGCGVSAAISEQIPTKANGCPTPVLEDVHEAFIGEAAIEDEHISLALAATRTRVILRSIRNKKSNIEHLAQPTSLFQLTVASPEACAADGELIIDNFYTPAPGKSLHVVGHMRSTPVTFFLIVETGLDDGIARLKLRLRNDGLATLHGRAVVPEIKGLLRQSQGHPLMAAVPQEAAGVGPFVETVNLGMPVNPTIGLPTAMNVMELVSIYDPVQGGGMFVLDTEGDIDRGLAPLQMALRGDALSGYWVTDLMPISEQELPAFVIGVHDAGDWHVAVDCYTRYHRPTWAFPQVPAWFREQGAIYSYSGAGAGAIYMDYPAQNLDMRISSFHELPKLLDEAKSLGTNIVYLWDYWQGAKEGDHPAYWNKGDYIPRSDLGGETGLREGIKRIHEQGGRVILYIEWFIIYWYSEICKEHGEEWAARDLAGNPYRQYPENFALVPATVAWRDYIVGVAARLVRDFDVDGIYLDSMGWEMNWPATTLLEHGVYTPKEYTRGALELTDRVRRAIRAIRPDAIVMGETTSGALPHHWDGGLSADFAWLGPQNQHKVLASPVRYGMPEINIYSNGNDRNEMNQIYAAGHSLALANLHLPEAPYIRKLVEVRQKYKDALIYGAQLYQPRTGDANVVAYFYRGREHNLITIVNISDRPYKGSIELQQTGTNHSWDDALDKASHHEAAEGKIMLEMEPKSLRVLVEASV